MGLGVLCNLVPNVEESSAKYEVNGSWVRKQKLALLSFCSLRFALTIVHKQKGIDEWEGPRMELYNYAIALAFVMSIDLCDMGHDVHVCIPSNYNNQVRVNE